MGDMMQIASLGARTVAEVNRKGGRVESGTQTADHCKVLNVGQTGSSPQRSLCPPEEPPKTSAHDRPSQ